MKTFLFIVFVLFSLSLQAANPTFQSFDTNAFNVNASGNTIGANTSGGNPNALVKQSQITAGGISLSQASNVVNGSSGVIKTNGSAGGTTFTFSDTGTNAIQLIAGGSITNSALTASTDVESDVNKRLSSLANGTGAKTNNGSGVVGWFNPQIWIDLSSNNAVNALPSRTNFYAVTNATAGNAVVVVGPDVNNQFYLKGTNWPTGGATVGDPLTNNFGYIGTNANTASTRISSNAVITIQTNGTPNIVLDPTVGISVSNCAVVINGALQQSGASNTLSGTSWITNNLAAIVPFSHPVTTSITNTFGTRCQPMIRYFAVGAVTGNPIITVSNETIGMLIYYHGASAIAFVETNTEALAQCSSGDKLTIRNESTGTGASAGIITNWFIPSL